MKRARQWLGSKLWILVAWWRGVAIISGISGPTVIGPGIVAVHGTITVPRIAVFTIGGIPLDFSRYVRSIYSMQLSETAHAGLLPHYMDNGRLAHFTDHDPLANPAKGYQCTFMLMGAPWEDEYDRSAVDEDAAE